MADTADQKAAETIARSIEGKLFRLQQEKDQLLQAQARIAEIDAEVAALQPELARVAGRRPPRSAGQIPAADITPTRTP